MNCTWINSGFFLTSIHRLYFYRAHVQLYTIFPLIAGATLLVQVFHHEIVDKLTPSHKFTEDSIETAFCGKQGS